MVFAEDIRSAILELADERGTGVAFSSKEIASRMDKMNSAELMDQVCLVASSLIKEGKISSLQRKGMSPDFPFYIKKTKNSSPNQ